MSCCFPERYLFMRLNLKNLKCSLSRILEENTPHDMLVQLEELVRCFWNSITMSPKPIVLFGAGGKGKAALSVLHQRGVYPVCFCDNNPAVQNTQFEGLHCLSYAELREKYKEYIIFISATVEKAVEIRNQLKAQGESNCILHFCVPFKLDYELYSISNFVTNRTFFSSFLNKITDIQTKKLFILNLYYKCVGDALPLQSYIDGESFFDSMLIPDHGQHTYLDIGAFSGDTLQMFHRYCNGRYGSILAVEPDKENFHRLEQFVRDRGWLNVEMINLGAFNKKGLLRFYSMSGEGAFNANFFKSPATTMDRHYMVEVQNGQSEARSNEIAVDTVDNILQGRPVTVLKTNAMGADAMILEGTHNSIQQWKPAIVLEYGSTPQALTDIPQFLMRIQPQYRFFLRQKRIRNDSKTLLYAL